MNLCGSIPFAGHRLATSSILQTFVVLVSINKLAQKLMSDLSYTYIYWMYTCHYTMSTGANKVQCSSQLSAAETEHKKKSFLDLWDEIDTQIARQLMPEGSIQSMLMQSSASIRQKFTHDRPLVTIKPIAFSHNPDLRNKLFSDVERIRQSYEIQGVTLNGFMLRGYTRMLADQLRLCPRLTHLTLQSCNLMLPDAAILAGSLALCASLSHLNLACNRLHGTGVRLLIVVLRRCKSLAYLNLSKNQLENVGAQNIAEELGRCTSLSHLNLSQNKIKPEGIKKLALALPTCAPLAHLDLSGNDIQNAGVDALAAVLPQCASLAQLNLAENNISDEGVGGLAAVLPQCRWLRSLDLTKNDIQKTGERRLTLAVADCASTLTLHI
jgi:hypothetical protein